MQQLTARGDPLLPPRKIHVAIATKRIPLVPCVSMTGSHQRKGDTALRRLRVLSRVSRFRPHCGVRTCVRRAYTRVRKPKKSFPAGFTWVSRAAAWRRRRRRWFKARRACLANISKTKCKLTRRPFGVYTTRRSSRKRGKAEGAEPREKRHSLLSPGRNNTRALFYRSPFFHAPDRRVSRVRSRRECNKAGSSGNRNRSSSRLIGIRSRTRSRNYFVLGANSLDCEKVRRAY